MDIKQKTLMPTSAVFVIFFALLLTPGSASAEGGWLGQAKEMLGNLEQNKKGLLSKLSQNEAVQKALPVTDIIAGLKEALRVGSESVVKRLGMKDGFNTDSAVHIPLPENLNFVKSTLGKIGMSYMMDDLELRLNRAAEAATPKAKALFLQSISQMTLEDAKAIYEGPNDAATRYFQGKMSKPLADAMRPIVQDSISQVGAIQSYDKIMGQYSSLPFMPDVKSDLTSYVTGKGMDGIFHYLAREEESIRKNPAKRTTEILERVFGN